MRVRAAKRRFLGGPNPSLAGVFVVISALAVRFALAPLPGYDVRDYRLWAGLVAQNGATAVYHADIFIPYNYPPVFLYLLDAVGRVYVLLSPSFDTGSIFLGLLLKTPPIMADAAIALAIYLYLHRRVAPRLALAGALAYGLNPAIIWNSANWGGIDSIHALLAFLAILLIVRGAPEAAWPLLALSMLTKPLSAPVVVVAALLTASRFNLKRVAVSGTAGAGAALLAVLPFLTAGTFGEMWAALLGNVGNYDNISVNAHNFWWLISGGYGWTDDAALLAGLASYRTAGLTLFGLFALWSLLVLYRRQREDTVFAVCALLGLALFMLPTEVHENWIFGAFPFLVVASVMEPRLRLVLVGFTATFWLNMALHDLYFGYNLPDGWLGSFLALARWTNSLANTVLFLYISWCVMIAYSGSRRNDSTKDTKGHEEEESPSWTLGLQGGILWLHYRLRGNNAGSDNRLADERQDDHFQRPD